MIALALGAALAFVVYVMRKSLGKRRGGDETADVAETAESAEHCQQYAARFASSPTRFTSATPSGIV